MPRLAPSPRLKEASVWEKDASSAHYLSGRSAAGCSSAVVRHSSPRLLPFTSIPRREALTRLFRGDTGLVGFRALDAAAERGDGVAVGRAADQAGVLIHRV